MAHAPMLSLSLLDADGPGTLEEVDPRPVNLLAYDASHASLSDGLISMSLVDDELLPQRIAG